jgi:hypothetical protein
MPAKRFPGMTGRSPGPNMMPGMLDLEQESKRAVEGVLPRSKQTVLDRSGVNPRYLDKKGTPSGLDARLNHLPPGMNIQDQKVAHIEPQPFLRFRGYKDGYTSAGDSSHGAGAGYFPEGEEV